MIRRRSLWISDFYWGQVLPTTKTSQYLQKNPNKTKENLTIIKKQTKGKKHDNNNNKKRSRNKHKQLTWKKKNFLSLRKCSMLLVISKIAFLPIFVYTAFLMAFWRLAYFLTEITWSSSSAMAVSSRILTFLPTPMITNKNIVMIIVKVSVNSTRKLLWLFH